MDKIEKNSSFEENMDRLEAIVRELEAGSLPLEDALKRFEEGVRLYRQCEERLRDAEQRIEILLKQADGTVVEAPFDASRTGISDDADGALDSDDELATPPAPAAPFGEEAPPSTGRGRSARRPQEPTPDLLPDDDGAGELPF